MSHPQNKRERFLVGKHKGFVRATGQCNGWKGPLDSFVARNSKILRNTTKLCSCMMCANPRRVFGEKTRQELKHEEDLYV